MLNKRNWTVKMASMKSRVEQHHVQQDTSNTSSKDNETLSPKNKNSLTRRLFHDDFASMP
jgi:hypothetical protein